MRSVGYPCGPAKIDKARLPGFVLSSSLLRDASAISAGSVTWITCMGQACNVEWKSGASDCHEGALYADTRPVSASTPIGEVRGSPHAGQEAVF